MRLIKAALVEFSHHESMETVLLTASRCEMHQHTHVCSISPGVETLYWLGRFVWALIAQHHSTSCRDAWEQNLLQNAPCRRGLQAPHC